MKCDRCGYSDNGSGDWAHACCPVEIQRQPVANERIKQLAEQANEWASKEESWKAHSQLFTEKFAELIVRECLSEIKGMMVDESELLYEHEETTECVNEALMDAHHNIAIHFGFAEHFGVEE